MEREVADMAKKEAPVIETQRLVLRRRTDKDIPRMVTALNHEEVRAYLGGYPPREAHAVQKIIRARTATEWAVTIKGKDEYIGECTINKIVDGYLGEIGYLFLRRYWNKGYAAESVAAVVDFARDTLGLGRLSASIDAGNQRSIHLVEKLGFERVALLPEADFGGRVADVAYYSLKLQQP